MSKAFPSPGLDRVYPSKVRPATPWEARRAHEEYGLTADPDWRGIEWSAHLVDVRLAGRSVRYVDLGSGEQPPVVFLHGLGANWQNWLENLPAVALERRAVALDLPGFGESESPAERITISGYARIVEDFCERLDLGPVVVVGNSMGGFVAAEMAISHPARVERLLLAGSAGISDTNVYRRPAVAAARATTAARFFKLSKSRRVLVRPHLRHLALAPVIRHPTRIDADLAHEVMKGLGRPAYASALDALLAYDFRDRLPEISCPVLLVWGDKDTLVPVADADEFARLIPQARKLIFEDVGHAPQLERAREFNRELLAFIGERPGGAPHTSSNGSEPDREPPRESSGALRSGG